MRVSRLILAWAVVALAGANFPAPTSTKTTEPYPAVIVTQYEFAQPRPLRAWSVRIDLTHPDIEFVVTPKTAVESGFEARAASTLAFAESEGVQLAINASPFEPLRSKPGEPMNINGLHLSRGELISPPGEKGAYGALLLTGDNRPQILPQPISESDLATVRNGVGGFSIVLANGVNRMAENPPNAAKHPRTAVGYSADKKFLWWLVVDGRQPGKSEGVTYAELAEWAMTLGISDLLNLDGGGSTTLVVQNPKSGKHEVVNAPAGGNLRLNGNNLGLRIYRAPVDLTSEQLRAVMPRLIADRATLFLGPLNRALAKHKIDNPARRAAFLAQLAHESGELKYMEEIVSGEAYEGRKSLGNTEPGDGKRYKGRGPIQLTGRANYRKAGAALGIDLENHPERVADPEIGCRVAGWFWESHGLNQLADDGDFRQITRRINGGYNGLPKREAYYEKAKQVLGVSSANRP